MEPTFSADEVKEYVALCGNRNEFDELWQIVKAQRKRYPLFTYQALVEYLDIHYILNCFYAFGPIVRPDSKIFVADTY